MTKKILTKIVAGIMFFLLGSFCTIVYFRHRMREQFVPHISDLTGMSIGEVIQLEVFEWPLDLLFPLMPFAIIICLIVLILAAFFKS